jgi:hypothetical protein
MASSDISMEHQHGASAWSIVMEHQHWPGIGIQHEAWIIASMLHQGRSHLTTASGELDPS